MKTTHVKSELCTFFVTVFILASICLVSAVEPSGINSGAGFTSTSSRLSGFGVVGQPFASSSQSITPGTNSVGQIYVLFGHPWNNIIDSNTDGIPNWWYELYGLDPLGPSVAGFLTGNNDYTYLDAFIANIDPSDPNVVPMVWNNVTLQSDNVQVQWFAMVNRTYRIWTSSSIFLPISQWTPYGSPVAGTGTLTTVQIPRGTSGQNTYLAITIELTQ